MSLDVALVAQYVREQDGQGQVMLELGRALVRRGHRLTVYTHEVGDLRCRLVRIPRCPGADLVDNALFFALATARLRRARHDAVVVMGACALPARPWIYYAQFSQPGWRRTWTESTRPGAYHRIHARAAEVLERAGAARAAALIACSPAVAADIGPAGPAHVVPNGVHVDRYRPPSPGETAAARARWGLPPAARVVGIVGEHRTGRKGLPVLMEAVAAGPGDEHVLVAGAADPDAIAAAARRLGLGDRVHVLGFQPAGPVMAACDVVAVPSLYEPFSIVALEAAAMGRPVVITATAGAAGFLPVGAVAVTGPTVAGLRSALDGLWAGGPDALAERGRAARDEAERLDWSATAAQAARLVEESVRLGD